VPVRADLAAACAAWRLRLPSLPAAGASGERLGRGTGSSLEFTDFRDYVPGDDLRHVDWRAYARTDAIHVRLFREEVAPHLDVVLDVSASMGVTDAKARAARDLAESFRAWAADGGARARCLAAGGDEIPDGESARFAARAPAEGAGRPGLLPTRPLRPRALRAVVSDFLWAHDPAPDLRRLAAGAAHLYVVQLLDPWEADPSPEGARTLVDVEEGTRLEVELDAAAVAGYRDRLGRLRDDVARAVSAAGGTYALVLAAPAARMFRDALAPQGVIEPA
jgi:uncharacterized protein (DUF58 family)